MIVQTGWSLGEGTDWWKTKTWSLFGTCVEALGQAPPLVLYVGYQVTSSPTCGHVGATTVLTLHISSRSLGTLGKWPAWTVP